MSVADLIGQTMNFDTFLKNTNKKITGTVYYHVQT